MIERRTETSSAGHDSRQAMTGFAGHKSQRAATTPSGYDRQRAGDLTRGGITGTLLCFTLPMIAGSLLQQCYNIADTIIVGRFVGAEALAAVGSAYTLMVFITSILIGLAMGSGTVFSLKFGEGDSDGMKKSLTASFILIGGVTVLLVILAFSTLGPILRWLQVPADVQPLMEDYLWIIYWGIGFTFLYNYSAALLRAVGDSVTPLLWLAGAALLNIGLDLLFILSFGWGIQGAAAATVISQAVSGIGLCIQVLVTRPEFRPGRQYWRPDWKVLKYIGTFSSLTCIQQSVMNLGILAVQGLVNSFGTAVMAAFAAAVKIDSFAYMPVQEFGNAFSTFVAQNYGADRHERIRKGIIRAVCIMAAFSVAISAIVFICADPLMRIFVSEAETEIIRIGKEYLRIEGAFYIGIGLLFMLYGYYRAICRPGMSVILTVLSLGTRVALSFALAPIAGIGELGIWWSIPIGWTLADLVGTVYYFRTRQQTVWKESVSAKSPL